MQLQILEQFFKVDPRSWILLVVLSCIPKNDVIISFCRDQLVIKLPKTIDPQGSCSNSTWAVSLFVSYHPSACSQDTSRTWLRCLNRSVFFLPFGYLWKLESQTVLSQRFSKWIPRFLLQCCQLGGKLFPLNVKALSLGRQTASPICFRHVPVCAIWSVQQTPDLC